MDLNWKALGWVVFAFVVALALFAGLLLQGPDPESCEGRRAALLEAKRDRLNRDMNDPWLIVSVAERAREAREAGCNVDDLIDRSVG